MKIYNLPRGSGKTTRMLYISEYTGYPILCINNTHKTYVTELARKNSVNIPEPVTIDKMRGRRHTSYLIDDAEYLLQKLLRMVVDPDITIDSITMSCDKNNEGLV